MNLKIFLEDRARQYVDRVAVACGETRLSYSELDIQSNRLANCLEDMGVSRGDRIAVLLPNSAEFAVIFLGIAKIGAIAVPLDARYKVPELHSLFKDFEPKVLFAESGCLESLTGALPRFGSVRHIIELGSRYQDRFLNYAKIMASASARPVMVEPAPEDVVYIGYTSGPSSHPHGAMVTQSSLLTEAEIAAGGFKLTDKDVVMLFALPMHHIFGLIIGLMGTLTRGGKLVIRPGLSLTTLMESIEREKGTVFLGVPYIFVLMTGLEGIKKDLSSLRLCISGGALLPDRTAYRFKELYGLDIGQVWGLTEGTANTTCTPLDGTWKLGSAGRALPGWEIKIVDDEGRELPVNHPGEVIVRGPIMKGYYNNPAETARVILDGWLHTGDIGRIDQDGDLFILGVKKRLIIVKGQNVWPVDIEAVLQTHPKIAESAVIGIPDELRGEIIGAAIRLKDGQTASEEDIRRFCRRYVINYKIPRQITFVKSIPRGAGGKLQKEALLELFRKAPASVENLARKD